MATRGSDNGERTTRSHHCQSYARLVYSIGSLEMLLAKTIRKANDASFSTCNETRRATVNTELNCVES
jgi:hypothetical protein